MALRGIGVRDILVLGNGPTERDALQASLAAHLRPPMGARAFGWEGLQVKSVALLADLYCRSCLDQKRLAKYTDCACLHKALQAYCNLFSRKDTFFLAVQRA